MQIAKFFKDTLTLVMWAIGFEGALFLYDALFRTVQTSPVWDATYNWAPLLLVVISVSSAFALLIQFVETDFAKSMLSALSPKRTAQKASKISG